VNNRNYSYKDKYSYTSGRNPKRRRSRAGRFFKSFVLTVIVALAILVGGHGLWRSLVRPPERPTVHAILPLHISPYYTPAFVNPEPNPADEDILDVLPPLIDSHWRRRENFFTFLIFGLDNGVNTDTIMVAAFDEATRRGYIISIPRDTQVDVQRRVRKINAAFPVGRLNGGGHTGGVEQLKREVQTLIGFRPDYYVALEMDVAVQIIDVLGGVEIDVPFYMRYSDPYQNLFIDIPPGIQMLDGTNAMHFARFRLAAPGYKAVTDFDRIEHQQQLLMSLLKTTLRPANFLNIPELARLADDMLVTDLELGNMAWFGEQLALARHNFALETYTLPIAGTQRQGWYELPCAEGILELVNRTVNPFTSDITRDMLRIAS